MVSLRFASGPRLGRGDYEAVFLPQKAVLRKGFVPDLKVRARRIDCNRLCRACVSGCQERRYARCKKTSDPLAWCLLCRIGANEPLHKRYGDMGPTEVDIKHAASFLHPNRTLLWLSAGMPSGLALIGRRQHGNVACGNVENCSGKRNRICQSLCPLLCRGSFASCGLFHMCVAMPSYINVQVYGQGVVG